MTALRPVLLERRALPKPWGGRRLAERFGSEPIGETWECFDRADGSSALRGADGTLHDLIAAEPRGVLGARAAAAAGGRFPLLLKFIDARAALSIQVHPGPEQAREHGDGPKDEAWVVCEVGPEARIVRGFRPGTTQQQIAASLRAGAAIEELVESFTPAVGDVVDVPHGTVHAIGPDVVVFEVQQNSDLTFRLWDWGRPRELHVDAALRALRLDAGAGEPTLRPAAIDERSAWLLRGPHFSVRRMQPDRPSTLGTEGSFKLLTVLDGMAALGWRSGGEHPPLALRAGDTALVPAAVDVVFVSPVGTVDFLWVDGGEAA